MWHTIPVEEGPWSHHRGWIMRNNPCWATRRLCTIVIFLDCRWMGQGRRGVAADVLACVCVCAPLVWSSRSTVYPLGTYLHRPTHVYLLHGCCLQFALRPLDFRRGAFDAQQLFLCEVRSTNDHEGPRRVRVRRRTIEEDPVDVHFSGISIFQ